VVNNWWRPDIKNSQIQKIEKRKVNCVSATLVSIAQGLEIELGELLEGLKVT